MRKWTNAQENAINSRGGTLLLSAAAGSGKTAVLVERVVSLVTDRDNPVDIDTLLIVTFSVAAANEMRQRISARLTKALEENPEDYNIMRQQILLSKAQIGTIHSFCLNIIKQNFQYIEISPEFSIADENELSEFKHLAVIEVIEECFNSENKDAFLDIIDLLSSGRDDKKLISAILKLYDFCRSHPFYYSWLDDKLELYKAENIADSVWGKILLGYAEECLNFCYRSGLEALNLTEHDEKLREAYFPAINYDLVQIEKCLMDIKKNDWDSLFSDISSFEFLTLKPYRGKSEEKERAKQIRDTNKDIIGDLKQKYINCKNSDFFEDINDLKPKIEYFFEIIKKFDQKFSSIKRSKKRLDFQDIEHLALNMLVRKTEGGFEKKDIAKKLAPSYSYIFIDEYQDTNEVQDLIFRSISGAGKNLFMVGDVKQSIYRFRQAMPEIFIRKKGEFSPYNGSNYPAVINLDMNFRSRKEIVDAVNFMFSVLMSEELGEIGYNEEESLKYGACYSDNPDVKPELLITQVNEKNNFTATEIEAFKVAEKISDMLKAGFTVEEDGESRKAAAGDFCILLRSPTNKAHVFEKALKDLGIPAWSESTESFIEKREVKVILAFLKILDNPFLDIELATILMSALFGFSDGELAEIRLVNRKLPLFKALLEYAEKGSKKAESFIKTYDLLKKYSAINSCDRLILKMYSVTDALALFNAMPLGEAKKNNLLLLAEYAREYHVIGYKGLSSFISFINRMEERGGDFKSANINSDNLKAVRIMSIHRSKGLEFPVVILADTAKRFNKEDINASALLHTKLGFACDRRDHKLLKQFSSIPAQAMRIELLKSSLSEEMRVLYVAFTRAKEKLIVSSMQNSNFTAKLSSLYSPLINGKIPAFMGIRAQSYSQWIIMALLHNESAGALREHLGYTNSTAHGAESLWDITISEFNGEINKDNKKSEKDYISAPSEELTGKIKLRTDFSYKYYTDTITPVKLAVSDLARGKSAMEYRFKKRPAFLSSQALTGAEKGSALHKFMQFANYFNAKDNLKSEIERMREYKFLSNGEADSLKEDKITRFFSSGLANRMFNSTQVLRELKFMAEILPEDLEDISFREPFSSIYVQGVADCVFIEDGKAVIVDYKTDHAKSPEELKDKYKTQLILYEKILAKSLKLEIKESIIYSFHFDREIHLSYSSIAL